MIITIARECGSGGHQVGERLAEKYQIPFYDREKLIEKAKTRGMYEEMELFFSEKPMNSLLYAISMRNENQASNRIVYEMMKKLIGNGSFVLMGRCGNDIFKTEPDFTSIFLHGEIKDRIARTMKQQDMEQEQAEKFVETIDRKRSMFHKYYSGQTWGEAKNYQMTLDSSLIGIDGVVKMVSEFIERKV